VEAELNRRDDRARALATEEEQKAAAQKARGRLSDEAAVLRALQVQDAVLHKNRIRNSLAKSLALFLR
jgi:hypothetical protein